MGFWLPLCLSLFITRIESTHTHSHSRTQVKSITRVLACTYRSLAILLIPPCAQHNRFLSVLLSRLPRLHSTNCTQAQAIQPGASLSRVICLGRSGNSCAPLRRNRHLETRSAGLLRLRLKLSLWSWRVGRSIPLTLSRQPIHTVGRVRSSSSFLRPCPLLPSPVPRPSSFVLVVACCPGSLATQTHTWSRPS